MVFLADVREIDVAQTVVGVKIEKERAIADGNVSRHWTLLKNPFSLSF